MRDRFYTAVEWIDNNILKILLTLPVIGGIIALVFGDYFLLVLSLVWLIFYGSISFGWWFGGKYYDWKKEKEK